MSSLLLAAARARGALLVRLGTGRLPGHHAGLHSSNVTAARRTARRAPHTLTAAAAEAAPEAEPAPTGSAASFKDLGVDTRLVPFLESQGIHEPTDVQSGAIPAILSGDNVAVRCYTGSGKTLAYLLPALTLAVSRAEAEWATATRKTSGQAGTVQVIVVAPSRELAMQIVRVAQSLLPESARRGVQQAIGGANIWRQRDALKMLKPFMVVGTPGRLAELSRDGSLQSHKTGLLILDEVDQLLAPQFREEMVRICEHTGKKAPGGRQTLLVSATLTPRVLQMCAPWCANPRQVFVGAAPAAAAAAAEAEAAEAAGQAAERAERAERSERAQQGEAGAEQRERRPAWGWGDAKAPSADAADYFPGTSSAGGLGSEAGAAASMPPHLRHHYVASAPQHKVDTLRRSIHAMGVQRALVFMNFQQRLKDTEAKLAARNMSVASLHGELTKQQRQTTLAAFRRGDYRALIVSDVAARGLDIPECDAVFHLELPTDAAHYAHRAGRTGRAGRHGRVISLVSGGERHVVRKLTQRLGVPVTELEVSHGEVAAKKHVSVAEVAAAIVATGGPKSSGTVAESCRFFDDKSTWTTTAKAGGPTNYDGQKDLSSLCGR
ncbi:DEAD-box ATP-dependent RNA helicase mitochondrial [Chlorella sorokiniana]|uniref:DEAD-box ATP-dependent RNA helicase mitochondrial n=1 Tax=Chlorella sorokiniana TaxID=3076 RepID=A0A2P6TP15_CHLSO|nr:DEAD-box ATP-dependent RNA helicase mitochondrial [Chlorella sorokiniana]|eukprot:PRW51077.1 DEAD-box ATP-dependent RNA helicase mitochondrial [Chlorella sorokiniana]